MDVALPIASVIPSLDGPVLAALAATTAPLTLGDVHRIAGRGSKSGIRKVLLRLVDVGVVFEVPGGFVLNRDHLAAEPIEALANLHGELAERIRRELEQWGQDVAVAGLFGSSARRDGDEESDIDVLVVSGADSLDQFTADLAARIELWTGNGVQVIGLSPEELMRLRRAGEPIVGSWDDDLVVICGDRRVLSRGR